MLHRGKLLVLQRRVQSAIGGLKDRILKTWTRERKNSTTVTPASHNSKEVSANEVDSTLATVPPVAATATATDEAEAAADVESDSADDEEGDEEGDEDEDDEDEDYDEQDLEWGEGSVVRASSLKIWKRVLLLGMGRLGHTARPASDDAAPRCTQVLTMLHCSNGWEDMVSNKESHVRAGRTLNFLVNLVNTFSAHVLCTC